MKCLWLEDRSLSIRDVPAPSVPPGEALLRVRLAGVCATDLELLRGYYPYTGIPGHEVVGEVVEAPSHPEWKGRRVVSEINAPCGTCPTCRAGRSTHCPERTVLGIVGRPGAFAELTCVPLGNLHEVPEHVPDEVAVFAEPLAAALRITEQVCLRPADSVVVLGAGRLGQLVARVVALAGCRLAVVARHERQRRLLSDAGIAIADEAALASRSADVVIEATGSPGGFELGRRLLRPGGTMVLKSTYAGELTLDASSLVVDEITLVGSRCGPFEPALGLFETGRVDPTPLIDATYPFAGALEAFEHAARSGVLKVLLAPDA